MATRLKHPAVKFLDSHLSLVQIGGPQPLAGKQVARLLPRDRDLNACFSRDHVFTKCLSSFALTASTPPKHTPLKRQYLKIGGELLAFNVDRNFSNALDGLVLVDLRKTDPARLETYMGKDGAERFMQHHGELAASR